eukprot:CAMPEP_0119373092 /NCGR_PEP_ID=MMETSP1334-20130426/23626_1 /TAXON_ID=127549 /ORGANISM="Calcidiscus leptoporus, Strain RCC1130" /LENGTH=79 /DNA_ID=CAMNT_0007390751 /DNA_START=176 /DNA_END=415 /DNA_ORIENTATION=+
MAESPRQSSERGKIVQTPTHTLRGPACHLTHITTSTSAHATQNGRLFCTCEAHARAQGAKAAAPSTSPRGGSCEMRARQ